MTIGLGWCWEGNLNTSLSLPFGLMKEGNSFILDALLLFKELDGVARYLVSLSTCSCFLSRSTSSMGAFPFFLVVSFSYLTSSHKLFTQFSSVSFDMLFGTICGVASNGLWDSSTVSCINSCTSISVGFFMILTCLEVLFLLRQLLVCCGSFVFVSLDGTKFSYPQGTCSLPFGFVSWPSNDVFVSICLCRRAWVPSIIF